MGTAYYISQEHGIVFSFAWGKITFGDVVNFRRRLVSDPQFHKEHRQLLDFTEVSEMILSSEDIFSLSQQPVFKQNSLRVVAAPASIHYGLSRMFLAYNPTQNILLFHTVVEAIAALGIPPEAYQKALSAARPPPSS